MSRCSLLGLSVDSGYGQHAAFFASEQPNWKIQTSEYEESKFDSIKAYASEHANVEDPVKLDYEKVAQPLHGNLSLAVLMWSSART
jgi:hypothetical protein